MEIIGLEVSALSMVVALVLMVRRSRAAAQVTQAGQVSELAQRTHDSSLESLHKNVESLAARLAFAERQLGNLFDGAQPEQRRAFESAPRLLEYRQERDGLAAQIDLPLGAATRAQARQEIIGLKDNSGKASAARAGLEIAQAQIRNTEARQHRARPQPLLLIDIVTEAGPVASGAVKESMMSDAAA